MKINRGKGVKQSERNASEENSVKMTFKRQKRYLGKWDWHIDVADIEREELYHSDLLQRRWK